MVAALPHDHSDYLYSITRFCTSYPLGAELLLKFEVLLEVRPVVSCYLLIFHRIHIIARETCVYSTVAFYNARRESLAHVTIVDQSKVSAINHKVFYFQQLKLFDNFKRKSPYYA